MPRSRRAAPPRWAFSPPPFASSVTAVNDLTTALAGSATLVAAAFALVVADRWHRRRQAHHGAWSIAMALFAVGSGALWWATATGWSSGVFRVFFTAGAVLNVSWLALGSLSLLAGERVARIGHVVLALFGAFAIGVMSVAPTRGEFFADQLPRARDHFGALPRVLAALGSGLPALVIFAGALWSIVRLARRRTPATGAAQRRVTISPRRLMMSNLLVAVGTLVLSASGSLAGRLGEERAFTVTLSVGVVILFAGFLTASARHSAQFATQHLAR